MNADKRRMDKSAENSKGAKEGVVGLQAKAGNLNAEARRCGESNRAEVESR
jgi:hypothetical protein